MRSDARSDSPVDKSYKPMSNGEALHTRPPVMEGRLCTHMEVAMFRDMVRQTKVSGLTKAIALFTN